MDFYLLGEVVQEVVHRELLSLLQDFVVLAGIWPGKEGTQEKNKGVRRRREGFKKKKIFKSRQTGHSLTFIQI